MLAHSEPLPASAKSLPPIPSLPSEPSPKQRDKALKRRLFFAALEAGWSKAEASRRAGCNANTASRWAKEKVEKGSDIPSKDLIVADLFKEYLKADTPYKANLAKRIFEAMGFAMRAQADDTNRVPTKPLRELVTQWWAESRHVKSDISPMKNDAIVQVSGADSAASEAGGSPRASASGGVRTNSPTITDSEKVSAPAAAENWKSGEAK